MTRSKLVSDTHCILMFSGGRDSTLAAVRLHHRGYIPVLVTVTSAHLTGIQIVRQRLLELKAILPEDTRWYTIRQPQQLHTDTSFYERTCLPCHHAYTVVGVALAMSFRCSHLAFGYVQYQRDWPEQTPLAIERLSAIVSEFGIKLLLPVYNVTSRDRAIEELTANGLSGVPFEQKCTIQVTNIALPDDKLKAQIDLWDRAIRRSAASLHLIDTAIIDSGTLKELVK
jgi:hypothetical protein